MDWQPTKPDKVSNTMEAKSPKKTKLVSKETLNFRRKQGPRKWCGKKGHKPPGCSFLSPLFKNLNINNTTFEYESDEEQDEIDICKLAQSKGIERQGKVNLP